MSKSARIRKSHTPPVPPSRLQQLRERKRPLLALGGSLAAVAIVVSFALPDTKTSVPASARLRSGPAPAFSEQDVVSGRPITSAGLRGKNVLLFFSEGVMCQACFEQIQSLEQRSAELTSRGLTLVNITTDPPDVLRQAVERYGLETPMISDQAGDMSRAYGAIGQGMHPNTDGHTFVLVDRSGRIRWRRDYTTMFVPPNKLLAAIPSVNQRKESP